jgi:hypothetical protein
VPVAVLDRTRLEAQTNAEWGIEPIGIGTTLCDVGGPHAPCRIPSVTNGNSSSLSKSPMLPRNVDRRRLGTARAALAILVSLKLTRSRALVGEVNAI